MTDAEKMREKQRRADLRAQGIDPDALPETGTAKKTYDDKFLQQYQADYDEEEDH